MSKDLLEEKPAELQKAIVQYCKDAFFPTKGINKKHGAYGLKQRLTRISGIYLTSRQFTQAMEAAGFRAEPFYENHGGDSDNWYFNINGKSPHFDTEWLEDYWAFEYSNEQEMYSGLCQYEPGLEAAIFERVKHKRTVWAPER